MNKTIPGDSCPEIRRESASEGEEKTVATLEDVAKLAEVSAMTVSRVITPRGAWGRG